MGHLCVCALTLGIMLMVSPLTVSSAQQSNATNVTDKCAEGAGINCDDGLVIPLWRPILGLSFTDNAAKGVLYAIMMVYMFMGVSEASDRFMSSIEVITSKEKEVVVKRPDGEVVKFTVNVWNETVSNLTLMALGSSAPEIMLSSIEVRRQKHLDVFFVTATWSLFAYAWLYIIVAVTTPNRIDIWEGVLTLLFFPITVINAYIVDTRIIVNRFIPKRWRRGSHGLIATEDVEMEEGETNVHLLEAEAKDPALAEFERHRREFMAIMKEIRQKNPELPPEKLQQMAEVEIINRGPKSRAFYRVQATRRLTGGGDIVKKKIQKEHHKSMEALAAMDIARRASTARIYFDPAHYTVLENVGTFHAVVSREGGPPNLTIMIDYYTEDGSANAGSDYMPVSGTLTFTPEDTHMSIPIEIIDDDVFEEDEHFYIYLHNLRVKTKDGLVYDPSKLGGVPVAELDTPPVATVMILDDDHAGVFSFETNSTSIAETNGMVPIKILRHSGARGEVTLRYKTFDGTAKAGHQYEEAEGDITFLNDQTEATIEVGIYNEEEYEKKKDFRIELYEPVWQKKLGDESKVQERVRRRLERKAGEAEESDTSESKPKDKTEVAAKKESKAGKKESTAEKTKSKAGDEKSDNQEMAKSGDDDIANLGKPRLGDITDCHITITESDEFHSLVDSMMRTAKTGIIIGSTSWKEQFIEALAVGGGEDDEGEEGEEGEGGGGGAPTWGDYLTHNILLPWKLLFAFIPPTDYFGGWACFVASICMIGLVTAFVGDLAGHLGCFIGLKDVVNAISFVALGTSVPDTFASRTSAVQDPYADNAVGNVTGSNAVNVFLGIGIAWTMAAVYHWLIGGFFYVPSGSLGFSVIVFTIEAIFCIIVMLIRRLPFIGGELGGPKPAKVLTTCVLVGLWLIYVLLSSLEAYCVIEGF